MTEEFKRPKPPATPSPSWGAPDPPPNRDRDDVVGVWADLVRLARDAEGFWEVALAGFGMLLAFVLAPVYLVAAVACGPSWAVGWLARKAFRSTRKVGLPEIPNVPPAPGEPGWRGEALHWPTLGDQLDAKPSDLRNNTLGGVPLRDLHAHKDTSPRPPAKRAPLPDGAVMPKIKPPPKIWKGHWANCYEAARECLSVIEGGEKRPDGHGTFCQWFSQSFVDTLRDVIERESVGKTGVQ